MTASAKADVLLRALGGKPAPAKLAADLERLAKFSPTAQNDFWNALGPSLDEPITTEAEQALEAYCQKHALDDAALAKVISAARFLVREAARSHLAPADFEADLEALVGDRKEVVQPLLQGYRVALTHLGRAYAAKTVAAHGGVVGAIDWRLERVVASSEARVLDVTVARMTLTTEGPEGPKALSLQLDMAAVERLRAACEGILEAGARVAKKAK